jgi:predicted Rdx family selenoprotein
MPIRKYGQIKAIALFERRQEGAFVSNLKTKETIRKMIDLKLIHKKYD